MTTPSTDASTDAAPLSPHNHGVSSRARAEATFIPSGKAIPIISPAGHSSRTAATIRTGVVIGSLQRATVGGTVVHEARVRGQVTRG